MWGSAPPPFYDDEHTPVSPEDFSILVGSCLDQLQEWRFGNSWTRLKATWDVLLVGRREETSAFYDFPTNALLRLRHYLEEGCAEEYDDWEEYVHNTANVKLFEREIEGYSLPMWRIEGTLPATIDECVEVLNNSDFEKRKKIDKFLKQLEVLERPAEGISVEYLEYSGIFPVSGRDAVYFKCLREFPCGTKVLFGQTINRKDKPQTSAAVRCKAKAGMYFIPTDNPFITRIIGFALVDPMGNIPKWLINKGKGIAPTVIVMLGKMLKDKYGNPQKRLEEFRTSAIAAPIAAPLAGQPLPAKLPHKAADSGASGPDSVFLASLVEVQSRLIRLLERTYVLEFGKDCSKSACIFSTIISFLKPGSGLACLKSFLFLVWPMVVVFWYHSIETNAQWTQKLLSWYARIRRRLVKH